LAFLSKIPRESIGQYSLCLPNWLASFYIILRKSIGLYRLSLSYRSASLSISPKKSIDLDSFPGSRWSSIFLRKAFP
jgi:hypothetical protein